MLQRFAPSPHVVTTALCCALTVPAASGAAVEEKRSYDLSAGDAATTLNQFAQTSGQQIVFMMEKVKGERTNAIAGNYAAHDALNRMLAGTGLSAERDPATGAFVVSRKRPNNSGKAAPRSETPRVSPPTESRARPNASSSKPDHSASMKSRSLLTVVATWLAAATAADAQTAPAPLKDETVMLSPFTVATERDEGWIANGTLLSNRTNVPLKDTPITIDALTKEFMQDVGAFNDFEAAKWVANVQVIDESDSRSATGSDFGRFYFRGLQNQWGTNRNFFRWYVPNDGYNLERIDFGRGSNSLMFGDNEPGGQATVYTKRARIGRTFTKALLQTGSFQSHRAEIDQNVSLGPKFAARFNLADTRDGRNFDFNEFKYRGYHSAMTFRPTRNTEVRAEAEAGGYDRVWGANVTRIQENPAAGLGFVQRFTILPNGFMLDRSTITSGTVLPDGNVYLASRDGSSGSGNFVPLLDRATRQVGNFTFRGFSENTNWGGPDQQDDRHYSTFTLYAEHRFTPNFVVEIAFNQQKQWNDVLNLTGSTYISQVDYLGRRYFDASYNFNRQQNKVQTPRVMAAYKLDRWKWMTQSLVATAEYRRDEYAVGFGSWRWLNAPGNATGNFSATTWQPYFRVYQDAPGNYPHTLARMLQQAPSGTRPFLTTTGGQEHQARAYSLSASGSYWGGRIQSLFGLRYDSNDTAEAAAWTNNAANRTPAGEFIWAGSKQEHPERWAYNRTFDLRKRTYTAGLVYMLSKSTNLYVTQSTSFRFAGSLNILDQPTGPYLGDTREIGLKSEFFNNKLQWNLTWYDTLRENVVADFNRSGLTDDRLQNALNAGRDSSAPDTIRIRPGSSRDTSSQLSRGWETTFQFFPARGLNVRLSGSYTNVTRSKAFPLIQDLLDAAAARNPTDPQIVADLALIRQRLVESGLDGQQLAGINGVPFSFNYVVDYRFRNESRLKGLSLGFNGNYNGDFVLGYFGSTTSALAVDGGKQFFLHGTVGYQRKLFGRVVNLRLNLYNLAAPEYRQSGIVAVRNNAAYEKTHSYGAPLSFRLTASTEF